MSSKETRVNRIDATAQVELLREAMNGKSTRRALLRRGMKAGLGFGALAGLMLTRGGEKAAAEYEGFGTCLLLKDYDCVADCQTAYSTCLRRNRASVCESQYRTCEDSCRYSKC